MTDIGKYIRRVLFGLIAASANGIALADWEVIGKAVDATLYVENSFVERAEHTVTVIFMVEMAKDQSAPGIPPYRRFIEKTEYDCKEPRIRIFALSHYPDIEGTVENFSYVSGRPEWATFALGTFRETLWKAACLELKLGR